MPQVSWHMWDVAIHWLIYPHCLPCFCIGSALYRGQALPYLQQLCCASVAIQHRVLLRSTAQAELHITPPYVDCYPAVQRLPCGWFEGLQ